MSGAGTVLSFIVVRQALTQGRTLPYVTALIELDEQPCLRNNAIVDADPDTVRIGQRVTVPVVEPVASGFPIAEFVVDEPAAN
ncbi:Zn-ribbon domain-containing OB-fold protein [Gordonia humi]|uniref:ChsH2 C-terminal OB-fold domain-containing protein n=1 Tax=Gordonia humi TaxID=686429 RepID=A0A840EQN6_9ACTN|nr:OB-fold domain-containing protein [Gordonia humi]MBB4135145.1 hypothetical protein [Gordonia humi]